MRMRTMDASNVVQDQKHAVLSHYKLSEKTVENGHIPHFVADLKPRQTALKKKEISPQCSFSLTLASG